MNRLRFAPAAEAWLRGGNMHVLITGATGWLGRAVLEMFEAALGDAMASRVVAFAAQSRPLTLRSGRVVAVQALTELAAWQGPPPIIMHFAFLTREHAAQMPLAAYAAANRSISAALATFVERHGALGLVLPSSGAVYATGGTLETDMARNPYGLLKLEDEAVFAALAQRLGFPAAILRVFNLAGPFINKLSSYALASIVADIARGGPVVLRAAHPVWRSYTHVEDVLRVALGIIRHGIVAPAFDTAGEPVEIGALAVRAAGLVAPRQDIQIIRPDWERAAPDSYIGDGDRYFRAATACGITLKSLDEQILSTATFIRQQS